MSLLLHEEELDRGRIAPYGDTRSNGSFAPIMQFFDYAQPLATGADYALLERVAAKAGKPIT